MAIDRKTLWKRLLFVPPILVGVAIIAIAVRGRDAPEQEPPSEIAQNVRVMEVPSVTMVPRALGFGNVQPEKIWEAVAQVSGTVTEIHPQLKKGALLAEGTVLLRIDPTDYQLTLDRINADIRAANARLREIDIRRKNTGASIAIENRSLAINERELARKKDLATRAAVSKAAVDQEERAVLSRQQSVQNLQNSLNLLPAERARIEAELAALRAQLADAKLDLSRTTVIAPFDARIAAVNVERTQFVNQGTVMASADGIEVAEVSAQVPIDKMLQLVSDGTLGRFSITNVAENIERVLGLKPVVRLRSGELSTEWPARVVRVSDTVDPRTRTVGVIVAVNRPYQTDEGNARPPLTKNMYVEVELRGRPRAGQIVVPREALHGGRAYVLTEDNRLEIRPIEILFQQGRLVLIKSGLKAGEKIVVSDLIPAINGMLLNPTVDELVAKHIADQASGGGEIR